MIHNILKNKRNSCDSGDFEGNRRFRTDWRGLILFGKINYFDG